MAGVAEKKVGSEKSEKLVAIFESARLAESFVDSLQDLAFEELIELKEIMDAMQAQEEVRMTWARFRMRVNRILGKKLFSLKDIENQQRIYKKLYEELRVVGGKIESDRKRKDVEYARGFLDYMRTIDSKELNPNLTEYNLNKYLVVGKEQKVPDENKDGKVVISYNESFEDNLKFLSAHIIEAIHRGNTR